MFKLVAMNELTYLLKNNSRQLQSANLTAEQAITSIDEHQIAGTKIAGGIRASFQQSRENSWIAA